jgi:hypothetical protein
MAQVGQRLIEASTEVTFIEAYPSVPGAWWTSSTLDSR